MGAFLSLKYNEKTIAEIEIFCSVYRPLIKYS